MHEQKLSEKTASAGVWSNFRRADGSIAAASDEMLKSATEGLSAALPSANACAQCDSCGECGRPSGTPEIVFDSVPRVVLEDYSGKEKCAAASARTKDSPLKYGPRRFESLDLLNSWISDLTQGKGTDGEQLYKQCAGGCSPRYRFLIGPEREAGFRVTAEVLCGHKRDKSDNQYVLATTYRWTCAQ